MKRFLGIITALTLLLTAVFPAYAADSGHVIINQVYGASNDGYADHSFIELYNPTGKNIGLNGWSVQYRSSADGEQAEYTNDTELSANAKKIYEYAFAGGWDNEFGGLLSFIDCKGFPPEAYEHDMKLWWPHNEMMIDSLMFYRKTGKQKYLEQFETVRQYCINHFCDGRFGEWYGYLRRDGLPTQPASNGSTFKGPFHVPRCLMVVDMMIDEIIA